MFVGKHEVVLDSKGRLNFPAKFRGKMGESFYVVQWVDGCLFALEEAVLEKVADAITGGEMMKNWVDSGLLLASATEVEPDAQGRILLNSEQRAHAGLTKNALVIGQGNHVEIWSPEGWAAHIAGRDNAAIKHTLEVQHV